jgi:tetratricopeptide (TPR) repeat protein
MAEHHDQSKNNKDAKDKVDLNLEIPHSPPPDDIEVVEEVIEVVEETAATPADAWHDSNLSEVLEVVEEGAPSPDQPQIVDDVIEVTDEPSPVAKKPKVTPTGGQPAHLTGRDPSQTMLAHEMQRELAASAELSGAAEHLDVAGEADVLDAEPASDPRMEPAGPPAAGKVPGDTHADVDLMAESERDPLSGGGAPPSSATIAAALAEAVDEPVPETPAQADELDEMDRTVPFPTSQEAPPKLPPADETDMDVVVEYEELLVDGESEIDLARKSGGKAERPSGVDIIAEALESGVELHPSKPPAPKSSSLKDDSDIAYDSILDEHAKAADIDSSSVDLGSGQSPALGELSEPHAKHGAAHDDFAGFHDADAVVDENVLLDAGTDAPDEEEILVTPKKRTMVATEDVIEEAGAEQAGLGLIDEEEPVQRPGKKAPAAAAAVKDDEGGGTATMTRARKQKSRFLPFVLGGFLAALVLIAAVGALWYLAPQLLTDMAQQSPNAPKQVAKGPAPGSGAGNVAAPVTSKAQEARKLLDDGKFDEAIAITKEDADKKDNDALLVHGLATLKKLERAKNGPLTAKDEGVPQALKEIEQGGAKGLLEDINSNLAQNEAFIEKSAVADAAKDKSMKLDALEKLLTEAKLPSDAGKLKATVADLNKARDATAGIMKTLAIKESADPGAVAKAVDEVIKKRDELSDSVRKLDDTLTKVNDAIVKAGGKDGYIKGVEELVALRDAAVKDRDALNGAIDAALKELKEANLLTADGDKAKQLVESTKKARVAGQSPIGSSLGAMVSGLSGLSKEPMGFFRKVLDNAKTTAELQVTKAQLALAESPDERLDMIVAVLKERGTSDAKVLTGFKNYIDWARSKDAKTSPQTRVKAHYAAALLERNRADFAAARKTLEETVKEAGSLEAGGPLETAAKRTLAELSDPAAYYLSRAQAKMAEGQVKLALDDLNAGLKVLPGDPQLLLKRAELNLLSAKGQGKMSEEAQKQIRDDAEGARKDAKLGAESYYIVGQMSEHNGDFAAAETNYREALKLAQEGQGDRYRIALARVLQRDRTGEDPTPEEPAGDDDDTTIVDESPVYCSAPQQPGDDDLQTSKRLEESIKLANELIQSPDAKTRGEGYILLGGAQAKLGKKTEGLRNFVKGLELINPGMGIKDLAKIIESHPAFYQPDVVLQSNPVQAERNFGKGLEFFWAKKYEKAEDEFKNAVGMFDQDARYRYFLGMSRYLQNTKEKKMQAEVDFEQGARLEGNRKPGAREINSSLERIQGELRRVLNSYREKMATAG